MVAGLTRRSLVLGAAAAPFAASLAGAQNWPSGPIRLVVPFPPGGSTDALARLVQTGLQQRLGVNIIIENKPGASGAAGTTTVAKSPPDGAYTWWGVFAPAGTPKPIVERFNKELAASIREERVTKTLTEGQQMSLVLSTPEELGKFSTAQGKLWGPVVKENDIKGEM